MSVLGALFSGVSGIQAESQALGIISDDIANANTTAFKSTDASFSTLVTQIPTATSFQPGGVVSHPSVQIGQQGLLQSTTSGTDLAISGGGFFVVNNEAAGAASGGAFTFTRAGGFTVDASGNLRNSDGFFLQGQKLTPAEATAIAGGNLNQLTATALTTLTTVNVNGLSGSAQPTANITLAANLPATDLPSSPAHTLTVPVFDSQGSEHDLTLTFRRVPPQQTFTVGGAAPLTTDTLHVTLQPPQVGATTTINVPLTGGTTLPQIVAAVNAQLTASNLPNLQAQVGPNASTIQLIDNSGNALGAGTTITDTPTGTTFTTVTTGLPPGETNPSANPNLWQASASLAGATSVSFPAAGNGSNISGFQNLVKFNPDGTLSSIANLSLSQLTVNGWATGGPQAPQVLNFNLGTASQSNGLTQFGSNFAVSRVDQDGLHFGNFTGITIDQNGIVTANFDNGLKSAIYLIPIATFPNPNGLAPQSGNVYLQTNDSGTFLLRQAGQGAAGQIAPSSLENSTVDIAQEFSNLIITQRAYEANTKIITTADQMLQSLLQAKQ